MSSNFASSTSRHSAPNPTDSKFPQGSREYQFFRAAIKWLEGKRRVLPGTFSKYLREAKRAASEENGMMNWSNLFDDRTPRESYKSVLNKVTNLMRDYAFSPEEGICPFPEVACRKVTGLRSRKESADKSIKEGIENVGKIATATASAIQKFQSGDASDIVSGTMEIISSVATFAGAAVGGPVGAAVGAIIGTVCSIIGAVLTANKPKQPSVVEQLANVVHKELVDFNKKLQDQTYNGLIGRVKEQILQLRTMKHGEKLADPNLWTDYVQFMGELSNRFESPLPFKYEDNLTKDPDVADFVTAVVTYCKVYNCLMALLVTAKGKFSDLDGERHFRWYMKMVDLKISSQREDAKGKLAFLSDKKYLTFLGRLPSEGGKLTKIVALCRNSQARGFSRDGYTRFWSS
ncbi:hypothetical protein OS493_029796 [Desmophyllum pertusum]|uniref:Uncharacterized protein n=1 Tax=Desmophyllum pertusum TaxID=174260 RepID=A0A9W9YWS1_9CNID|nr:hypothetical protein OS493_029796 [Desmophyllum pertusum]